MNNSLKNFFGCICILFSLTNIFTVNNFGFSFQTGTGSLNPSNAGELIGYNFAALVWYFGTVWFLREQYKKNKIRHQIKNKIKELEERIIELEPKCIIGNFNEDFSNRRIPDNTRTEEEKKELEEKRKELNELRTKLHNLN